MEVLFYLSRQNFKEQVKRNKRLKKVRMNKTGYIIDIKEGDKNGRYAAVFFAGKS